MVLFQVAMSRDQRMFMKAHSTRVPSSTIFPRGSLPAEGFNTSRGSNEKCFKMDDQSAEISCSLATTCQKGSRTYLGKQARRQVGSRGLPRGFWRKVLV